MHVPDGFLDAPVSVGAGLVAATAVAVSLRGARRELSERTAPLAGLVAAFVFAVQLLNFPVGAGTSGHLLGGALAAILVGPYTAVLCLSVVLLMQAVLFADGGLTALGVNITLMGVVTAVCAYALFRAVVWVLPRGQGALTVATFVAALVSVPASAAVFAGMYTVGGTADVAHGTVFAAMVGVHLLIGLGEAVITTLTVGSVLAVRPDLVYAARGLTPSLTLRTVRPQAPRSPSPGLAGAPVAGAVGSGRPEPVPGLADRRGGSAPGSAAEPARAPAPRSPRPLWLAGLTAAVLAAGAVSFYASSDPDGLERVAADHGLDERQREHGLAGSPLADYGVSQVDDERLSLGIAGVLGVGSTLAVGSGVFLVVRRRDAGAPPPAPMTPPAPRPPASVGLPGDVSAPTDREAV